MRTLYLYSGGLLRVGGSLAAAAACCCGATACNCNDDASAVRVAVRIVTNAGTYTVELAQQAADTWGASVTFETEHAITTARTEYTIWAEAVCVAGEGGAGHALAVDLYCSDGGAFIHTGSANDITPPSCGNVESFDPSTIDSACSISGEGGDTINVEFCATCDGTDPTGDFGI